MIYDLNQYRRVVKPQIEAWQLGKFQYPLDTQLSELALYTGAPLVVVGHLIGEVSGYTESLKAQLTKLEEFYRVESVEGKQDANERT